MGRTWEDSHWERANTIGGGVRWIINPYVNFEFKYLWGDKPESGPGVGAQFKFGDNKASKSFFYNALYSPPERYLPRFLSINSNNARSSR